MPSVAKLTLIPAFKASAEKQDEKHDRSKIPSENQKWK
jgi:hypothetical protein